jgi:Fic family protein
VPGFIADLDRWVRANEGKMSAEQLAAEVHNALVGIHPPFDGNGRTSKLVIDFLLARAGIEPPIWRQRHPLKEPTTPATIRTGVLFTHETVRRHWLEATRREGA